MGRRKSTQHTHSRRAQRSKEHCRYCQSTSRSSLVRRRGQWCRPRLPTTDIAGLKFLHGVPKTRPRSHGQTPHGDSNAQGNTGACRMRPACFRCAPFGMAVVGISASGGIGISSDSKSCRSCCDNNHTVRACPTSQPEHAHSGGHAVDIRLRTGFH